MRPPGGPALLTFASLPLPDFRGISAANFQPEATGVPDLAIVKTPDVHSAAALRRVPLIATCRRALVAGDVIALPVSGRP
jgi:hypothetical protein